MPALLDGSADACQQVEPEGQRRRPISWRGAITNSVGGVAAYLLCIWRAPRVGQRPLISVFSRDPQHAGGLHADRFALTDQRVLNLRECRDNAKEAFASRRSRINALQEGRKIRCLSVPTLSRSRKIERRTARSIESTNNQHTAFG
jgi:hypothetical protein